MHRDRTSKPKDKFADHHRVSLRKSPLSLAIGLVLLLGTGATQAQMLIDWWGE